jgi:GrpB-like predicted nucleotidyltransferase (UPF0157 family)
MPAFCRDGDYLAIVRHAERCSRGRLVFVLRAATLIMIQHLQVVSYDPHWVVEFEVERGRIAAALGGLARRIDHNGSTAVPGLEAKPIIDIQISVWRLHPLESYLTPLARLGYVHMPHADDDVCPFLHRPGEWPHTHHVHLVQSGGAEERKTLAFRDFLRDQPDVAREYGLLKRNLAVDFDADDASDREAYANAKSDFIERIVRAALAAGYPRDL